MSGAWLDISDAFEAAIKNQRPFEHKPTAQHDAHVSAYYGGLFLNRLEAAWIAGKLTLSGLPTGGNERIPAINPLYAADYRIVFRLIGVTSDGCLTRRKQKKPKLQFLGHMFLGPASRPSENSPSLPRIAFYALRVMASEIDALFPPKETPAIGTLHTSDDEVCSLIRAEAAKRDGNFISQKNGAAIVRAKYPGVSDTHARELVKRVTGNEKRGPRGQRKKLAE